MRRLGQRPQTSESEGKHQLLQQGLDRLGPGPLGLVDPPSL